MMIPKVLGIETEYGISGGPDNDPVTASGLVVNAYAQQGTTRLHWDFTHESPGNDARTTTDQHARPPAIERELANTVLTNGARLYVDHAHPEYSSPEVRTPRQGVLYDVAGEEIMRRAMLAVNETLPPELAVRLFKNNSDGKGNAYGMHENYLTSREVPFDDLVQGLIGHFISRCIVTGAGKVGAETDETRGYGAPYSISARAEFFEVIVGLETTLKRPIINTRDEPHCDPRTLRRLHVINGDANMSQVATLLKLGVTSLLLARIEERGIAGLPPVPIRPVSAFRAFSRDPLLATAVDTDHGRWTALNYQEALLEDLRHFHAVSDTASCAPRHEVDEILSVWEFILDGLRTNRDTLHTHVDWIAKLRIVEGFQERHGLAWDDPRLKAIDLQYHDIDRARSLGYRAGLASLVAPEAAEHAVLSPPKDTRAYFRGEIIRRFPDAVVTANWDSIVLDTGEGPYKRLTMADPLRGTKVLTESLLSGCSSAADVVVAMTD